MSKMIGANLFRTTMFLLLLGCSGRLVAQSATGIRPQIQSIAKKLSRSDGLHLGLPVGYSGQLEQKNKFYKLYQQLSEKATTEELVALTTYESKSVVLYSFVALRDRSYTGLKSIFLDHLHDTAFIWQAGGCTGTVDRVNTYMLAVLHPDSVNLPPVALTNDEYAYYEKLISNRSGSAQ